MRPQAHLRIYVLYSAQSRLVSKQRTDSVTG